MIDSPSVSPTAGSTTGGGQAVQTTPANAFPASVANRSSSLGDGCVISRGSCTGVRHDHRAAGPRGDPRVDREAPGQQEARLHRCVVRDRLRRHRVQAELRLAGGPGQQGHALHVHPGGRLRRDRRLDGRPGVPAGHVLREVPARDGEGRRHPHLQRHGARERLRVDRGRVRCVPSPCPAPRRRCAPPDAAAGAPLQRASRTTGRA